MELIVFESTDAGVRAGYSCPCGCTPAVQYERGAPPSREGCCCGNQFAVGPHAATRLVATPGFHHEAQAFASAWGEGLEATRLVGPSVHPPAPDHEHVSAHDEHEPDPLGSAIDPVCGMSVLTDTALARGLHLSEMGADYFFCGRGCKLEFGEDPGRYLDPAYIPSM